jgi:hypothetical protein
MTAPTSRKNIWALGGVLFAAFFIAGDFLAGALAAGPLPMPGAPAEEVVRYFTESSASALAVASVQVLSALSLLVFVAPVATLVRRVSGEGRALIGLTSGGGVLSAALLLVCALLGFVLVLVASGGNLALVEVLRQANFLTGGTLHVASLGVFVGAASIAARRAKALPRWISWLGFLQATLAILSLASLVFFPAALFILLGRMLGFLWCISAGLVLALGRQHNVVTGTWGIAEHGDGILRR